MEIETKGLRVNPAEVTWLKSSRSMNDGACVEVAFVEGGMAMRDSKDPDGPVLLFNDAEWTAFVLGAKDGEFDVE